MKASHSRPTVVCLQTRWAKFFGVMGAVIAVATFLITAVPESILPPVVLNSNAAIATFLVAAIPLTYTCGQLDRIGLNANRFASKEDQRRVRDRLKEVRQALPISSALMIAGSVYLVILSVLGMFGFGAANEIVLYGFIFQISLISAYVNLWLLRVAGHLIDRWAEEDLEASDW